MSSPFTPSSARRAAPLPARMLRAYGSAGGLCLLAALLAAALQPQLDPASLVLVFMLAVVLSAASHGRGPALWAAALSVMLFNLLVVPPRLSLSVADPRFFFTFAIMLVVGLVVGHLTAGLRGQANAAARREQQVRSLYDFSRELGAALTTEQTGEHVRHFMAQQLGATALLWSCERPGGLQALGCAPAVPFMALAQQAIASGRWCEGSGALALPLPGTMAPRGALALLRPTRAWSEDERRLISTCASLLGSTLERIHYIAVARDSAVEIEGERLRSALLAAISHDLRTPLASLVGLAGSLGLTRPALSPQQHEIAEAMARTARRMSTLVSNLLDMARLESGSVRLDLQWQPIEEVIGAAIAAAEPALDQHSLTVDVAEDMPLLRMDAVLMERVLVNLLENAAKYTPPGSRIEISATPLDAQQIALVVSDNGPGLPSGGAAQLFRKFERGVRESATPGVGLGLALCRAIVEAHQGHIAAEGVTAGGARFVIRLPRGEPPAGPQAEPLGRPEER